MCGLETAHKVLTIDYLADQLTATNPRLNRAYQTVSWIIPGPLRRKPYEFNIGEFVAYARRA